MINLQNLRQITATLMSLSLLAGVALSENILLPVTGDSMASIPIPARDISEASNQFGFKLLQKLSGTCPADSNVCISPLSISSALTMTCNGAAGKTREAMTSTLEISGLPTELVNESYRQLTSVLATADPSLVMQIANSIWYRKGLEVKAPFLDLSRTGFDAAIQEFDSTGSGAADKINSWVRAKTENRIKRIIAPPLDPDVIMLLINAVYFRAAWTTPFDPSNTQTVPFKRPDGSRTECEMMERPEEYQYMENERLQAVDLPYGNGKFSMTVLLPRAGFSVDELIEWLDEGELNSCLDRMSLQDLRLFLPRFRFSTDFGLNEALKAMGMNHTFAGQQADFSNMTEGRVWIDSVIHKAFIQVDEQGTEAAAATAVVMKRGLMPSMVVDRPFVILIRHRESNTILFLGKVVNPVWEEDA